MRRDGALGDRLRSLLPEVVKAGITRRGQRALTVAAWEDFRLPDDRPARRVAIVGNAGYLAELDQADAIDGCDLVLRINNFRTRGFERQVGRRCDIFLTNFFTDIDYGRPELAGIAHIVGSVPNAFRKRRDLGIHDRHAETILAGMRQLGRRSVFLPTLDRFLEVSRACEAVPSAGLMAVDFALGHLPAERYLVTGFSFFRGREHYFPGDSAPRLRHDFARERRLLADLILPRIAAGEAQTDPVMLGLLRDAVR